MVRKDGQCNFNLKKKQKAHYFFFNYCHQETTYTQCQRWNNISNNGDKMHKNPIAVQDHSITLDPSILISSGSFGKGVMVSPVILCNSQYLKFAIVYRNKDNGIYHSLWILTSAPAFIDKKKVTLDSIRHETQVCGRGQVQLAPPRPPPSARVE